jgi:hypothetical protein
VTGSPVSTYSVWAVPIMLGTTGYRTFCSNNMNPVLYDPSGGGGGGGPGRPPPPPPPPPAAPTASSLCNSARINHCLNLQRLTFALRLLSL